MLPQSTSTPEKIILRQFTWRCAKDYDGSCILADTLHLAERKIDFDLQHLSMDQTRLELQAFLDFLYRFKELKFKN